MFFLAQLPVQIGSVVVLFLMSQTTSLDGDVSTIPQGQALKPSL